MFICSVILRQLDLYRWLGDHYYFVENFRCYLKFYEGENFSDLFIFPLYFRIRKGYFPFLANNRLNLGNKMRTKQSTLNLHSIPDQKGYFCKRREIWRETPAPMWLLIGRVIFVTREKSSFAFPFPGMELRDWSVLLEFTLRTTLPIPDGLRCLDHLWDPLLTTWFWWKTPLWSRISSTLLWGLRF